MRKSLFALGLVILALVAFMIPSYLVGRNLPGANLFAPHHSSSTTAVSCDNGGVVNHTVSSFPSAWKDESQCLTPTDSPADSLVYEVLVPSSSAGPFYLNATISARYPITISAPGTPNDNGTVWAVNAQVGSGANGWSVTITNQSPHNNAISIVVVAANLKP
jgi:hypothetical protein